MSVKLCIYISRGIKSVAELYGQRVYIHKHTHKSFSLKRSLEVTGISGLIGLCILLRVYQSISY
jgi:hypothetical protein